MNEKVIATIRATFRTGGIYTSKVLAEQAGVTPRTARRVLDKLASEGSLYFEPGGRFRVTRFGPLAEGRSAFV